MKRTLLSILVIGMLLLSACGPTTEPATEESVTEEKVVSQPEPVTEAVEEPTVAEAVEEEDRTLEEGELSVSGHVSLARFDESVEFHNPLYFGATKGCAHASVALALREGQVVKLTLESDCPISWDVSYHGDEIPPGPEVGVIFAEMRTYREGEGWWAISSVAKEVKQVSSSNGGRQFEIVLTPAGMVGGGELAPPGTGIYKLLAFNLDPHSSHYLKYSISVEEEPAASKE